jgi:hypothetical protein
MNNNKVKDKQQRQIERPYPFERFASVRSYKSFDFLKKDPKHMSGSCIYDSNANIDMGNSGCHGIEYDQTGKRYTFWVRTYFDEFKNAVNCYIDGLE